MGSHSYLQNLASTCDGVPAAARQFMQCDPVLVNLATTCDGIPPAARQFMQCDPVLQNLMIGPAYTYDPMVPKPLGTIDMGSYTGLFYTPEQINAAKLNTDLLAANLKPVWQIEEEFNGSY